jgi:ActR/RegA family two-component response regulator
VSGSGGKRPRKGTVPRLLVVDHEESILSFAERALRDAGYEVVVASSGAEVLRIVEAQRPFDLFVIQGRLLAYSTHQLPDFTLSARRSDASSGLMHPSGFYSRISTTNGIDSVARRSTALAFHLTGPR